MEHDVPSVLDNSSTECDAARAEGLFIHAMNTRPTLIASCLPRDGLSTRVRTRAAKQFGSGSDPNDESRRMVVTTGASISVVVLGDIAYTHRHHP